MLEFTLLNGIHYKPEGPIFIDPLKVVAVRPLEYDCDGKPVKCVRLYSQVRESFLIVDSERDAVRRIWQAKSRDAMPHQWSKQPPDKPGWWWCRGNGSAGRPVCVFGTGGVLSTSLHPLRFILVSEMPGYEWAGPIEKPPQEVTESGH